MSIHVGSRPDFSKPGCRISYVCRNCVGPPSGLNRMQSFSSPWLNASFREYHNWYGNCCSRL